MCVCLCGGCFRVCMRACASGVSVCMRTGASRMLVVVCALRVHAGLHADMLFGVSISHAQKRMRQIKKQARQGLLDADKDDPFALFVASTNIRYCYYKDTHKILGNTFGMCVLQVRTAHVVDPCPCV
jgi:tRNA(Met) C34 N-acetyltransferase TmcA